MTNRIQRRARIKKTVKGTSDRPRLVVFKSNRYFHAQIIDDTKGHTLLSVNKEVDAQEAGKKIAKIAQDAKIKAIVFDRAGYKYHGNVKKFADAVREGGIKF